MLPKNFDTLARDYPALSPLWDEVRRWDSSPTQKRYFDPRDVVIGMCRAGISPGDLALAMHLLVSAGVFVRVYKAWSPNSMTFVGGEYPDPMTVPLRLRDSFDNVIDVERSSVLPLFRKAV